MNILILPEMYVTVSAIPFNLMMLDTLGRKWTLGLDFLGAAVFLFLAQICNSHTVFLTITLFGVRSFISGVFNTVYIYTSEVRFWTEICSIELARTIFLSLNIVK